MSSRIVYFLLVGHFVADFLCQSDWMALNKSKRWDALAAHVAAYSAVLGGFAMLSVGHMGITAFIVPNAIFHFVQDAITSRWTSRLWFIELRSIPTRGPNDPPGYWSHTAHIGASRHWFFVVIGFDQLLHYVTLFVTAQWWLR